MRSHASWRAGFLFGAALLWAPGELALAGQAGASAQPAMVPVPGRVVEPDGKPVSNATIVVVREPGVRTKECLGGLIPKAGAGDGFEERSDCLTVLRGEGAVRAEAVSGPEGRFVLNVPSGLSNLDYVRVEAVASDRTLLFGTLPIAANRQLPVADLRDVVAYRWYEFVVVAVGNGKLIRDAEVIIEPGPTYRTNADGQARHRFQASESGSLRGMAVTVRASGFADEAWFGGVPAQNTTQLITLIPETRVSGRALDPAGRPVPGATLRLESVEPWLGPSTYERNPTLMTAQADADGRFTLGRINPARRYRLVAVPPAGSGLSQIERFIENGAAPGDVVLGAAGRLDLELRLAPLLRNPLTLQMLGDPERSPLGRPLSIEWFDPSSGEWQVVLPRWQVSETSAGLLRVHLEQVPAGLVRVSTRSWPGAVGEELEPVSIVAGETLALAIDVRSINQPLRVQVVDSHGQPIAGARVDNVIPNNRQGMSTANAEGVVNLEVHPERELRIKVSVSGKVVLETVLPPGVEIPPVLVLRVP